jgi:hypothetical protein
LKAEPSSLQKCKGKEEEAKSIATILIGMNLSGNVRRTGCWLCAVVKRKDFLRVSLNLMNRPLENLITFFVKGNNASSVLVERL